MLLKMIPLNYRIVEGQPLHYYNYVPYETTDQYSYFRQFEPYSPRVEMSEHLETLSPASPNSTQSDSENSVSSVEISQRELRISSQVVKTTQLSQVQCKWRSCGILFPSLDQLATHVSKVHSASGLGGLFYCGWEGCTRNNKGFNARYKMLVHVRTHTNEKPHKCFQCEKSFSRAENLKIHSRSHSGEKPYICPVPGCNKAYSNSSDRFKHTRTHQVDKPYQCKIPGCPKRYTDPSSLRKHVKTYKHFVNENQKSENVQTHEESLADNKVEERLPVEDPLLRKNVIRHTCNCSKLCTGYSRSELFKIGNLINLNKTEKCTWNNLIDPFIIEQNNVYRPYEESMQVDGPLDLSLHRREF